MGAALREAWLWVLLAFLLGLAIGYFVRQQPVRVRASTGGTSTGTPTTPRIAAFEAPQEVPVGDQSPAALIPATAKVAHAGLAALTASAPATVVVPVERAATTRATAKQSAITVPATTKQSAITVPATTKEPATTAPATKSGARKSVSSSRGTRKPSAKAAVLDLAAAKATLGVTVKLDDLKLIEGIGPKIETLFKADGITSWHELSRANVERLQGVLDAAGPRYKFNDPASWPRQAGLLATGKWAEFQTLTDKLKDGR